MPASNELQYAMKLWLKGSHDASKHNSWHAVILQIPQQMTKKEQRIPSLHWWTTGYLLQAFRRQLISYNKNAPYLSLGGFSFYKQTKMLEWFKGHLLLKEINSNFITEFYMGVIDDLCHNFIASLANLCLQKNNSFVGCG